MSSGKERRLDPSGPMDTCLLCIFGTRLSLRNPLARKRLQKEDIGSFLKPPEIRIKNLITCHSGNMEEAAFEDFVDAK